MARPKESETIMTKQGKKTYRLDKKTGKKLTGRPFRIDEAKIQELEKVFMLDVNIDDACAHVGISPTTYYAERERNKEFAERMDRAKSYLNIMASRTIEKAVVGGDLKSAMWYKEKRDENYKQKPAQISMQQGVDPETGQAVQGFLAEFVLKD